MFWIYYTLTWWSLVLLWTKIVQDKFEYEKKYCNLYENYNDNDNDTYN